MTKEKKYYVVWQGRKTGVFETWSDCKEQILNVKGAKYKAFPTYSAAKQAFRVGYKSYVACPSKPKVVLSAEARERIEFPNAYSISVDAASSGNPGRVEYRGVDTNTKEQLFIRGPFEEGTNNIGEFLAIVHGLSLLKKNNSRRILYSDSTTAICWVRAKHCNTKLKRSPKNKVLFDLVDRAVIWLKENSYKTPVVKWETKTWGEIPADFGRK